MLNSIKTVVIIPDAVFNQSTYYGSNHFITELNDMEYASAEADDIWRDT